MFKEIALTIFNFLSNHFEYLSYSLGTLFIVTVFLYWGIKLSQDEVQKRIGAALYSFFTGAIIFGILVCGFVYLLNYYFSPPAAPLINDVAVDLSWVKQKLTLYYAEDNVLNSIQINGTDKKTVLVADSPIREFHFSPDGSYLLVGSMQKLYLLDLKTNEHRTLAQVKENSQSVSGDDALNGVVCNIKWAPDSRKFCYEIARWSKYASQSTFYVFDLNTQSQRAVQSPTRALTDVYWDRKGENLYSEKLVRLNPSDTPYPFEIQILRIPLDTMRPQYVTKIPLDDAAIVGAHLSVRDIDLYTDQEKNSFVRHDEKAQWISDQGLALGVDEDDYLFVSKKKLVKGIIYKKLKELNKSLPPEIRFLPDGQKKETLYHMPSLYLEAPQGYKIGIDKDQFLYFVRNKWFRKRLFKIDTRTVVSDFPHYQYRPGEYVISRIRWLPGGKYAVMKHREYGLLILDPANARLSQIVLTNSNLFGWYE